MRLHARKVVSAIKLRSRNYMANGKASVPERMRADCEDHPRRDEGVTVALCRDCELLTSIIGMQSREN